VIPIKNIIEYFYKIPVLKILNKGSIYSFKYNSNEYIFMPAQRTELELTEIHHLTNKNNLYDKLIQNIEKKYLTLTSKGYYILLKKSTDVKINLENIIVKSKLTPILFENYQSINRTDWVKMWTKKIDYVEYQLLHIENKYPLISKSINYYIGMTETAISYLTDNTINKNETNVVISHKRVVTEDNFNNPMNIIVDYFARDISEYLKYIFIKDDYNYADIILFLNKCDFSESDGKLIYARLMYPSHYFDLYDRIISGNDDEKKILSLISRSVEYEKYVKNIYAILTKNYSNIFTTEWI
jgi:hypothetical protein